MQTLRDTLDGRRGVPEHVAAEVFRKIIAFSAFGFPKSHSAAFALLAYQSAWLRRHHPEAFLVALLVAQSRVEAGFHSSAEVVAGALLGASGRSRG